jgi:enoyl reductase-like protein
MFECDDDDRNPLTVEQERANFRYHDGLLKRISELEAQVTLVDRTWYDRTQRLRRNVEEKLDDARYVTPITATNHYQQGWNACLEYLQEWWKQQ